MSSVAALRHTIGEQSALAGQCLHNGDFDQARDLIAQTRDSLAAAEAAARAAAESAGAGADGLVPRWISDKRAECYVREALFAQRAGAAGKACGLLLKAEELNPDCGTVHINLISVLEHLGARHEQILSRAKRAIVVLEERVRDDSLDDASRQGTNELLALAYLKYAGALESHVKEDIESEADANPLSGDAEGLPMVRKIHAVTLTFSTAHEFSLQLASSPVTLMLEQSCRAWSSWIARHVDPDAHRGDPENWKEVWLRQVEEALRCDDEEERRFHAAAESVDQVPELSAIEPEEGEARDADEDGGDGPVINSSLHLCVVQEAASRAGRETPVTDALLRAIEASACADASSLDPSGSILFPSSPLLPFSCSGPPFDVPPADNQQLLQADDEGSSEENKTSSGSPGTREPTPAAADEPFAPAGFSPYHPLKDALLRRRQYLELSHSRSFSSSPL